MWKVKSFRFWNCVCCSMWLQCNLSISLSRSGFNTWLTLVPGVPVSPFVPESPYNKPKQHNYFYRNFYKLPSNQTIIWWKLIRIILTVTPFGPGAPGIPASPWRPCEINKTNTCINKSYWLPPKHRYFWLEHTEARWGRLKLQKIKK